ncbi:MAG: hypothetical protein KDE56_04245 [Anaerolineales bacterium]|nr:hypothetical protein [Anaerolineales bacterium]
MPNLVFVNRRTWGQKPKSANIVEAHCTISYAGILLEQLSKTHVGKCQDGLMEFPLFMSEVLNNNKKIALGLGITDEELLNWYHNIVMDHMPIILKEMLSRDLVDLDKREDRFYLWTIVKENALNILPGLERLTYIHDEFVSVAQYAIENEKHYTAIILIATAIEHSLNLFYRELLTLKGLSAQEITQIIRSNNIQAKTNWLLSLIGQFTIPDDMKKSINDIIELRNALVHYKAVPTKIDVADGSWEMIRNKLKQMDIKKLMIVPDELDELLDSELDKLDPNRQLAVELTDVMFASREVQSDF